MTKNLILDKYIDFG